MTETLTEEDIIYWMGWMMDAQRRLYDVMLTSVHLQAIALDQDKFAGKAKELQELHESGKFLFPPLYAQD